MKNPIIFRLGFLVLIYLFLFNSNHYEVWAQDVKKNKLRISADYVKIMDGESYINIKASSRINKKNVKAANIELIISNEMRDEVMEMGRVITNMDGASKYEITSLEAIRPDSLGVFTILISFNGSDLYKKTSKSIKFKDALIYAEIATQDSVNYMSARLLDAITGKPIQEQSLTVQVKRLFMPLIIGEEFNYTDDEGSIRVPVENNIPGIDGDLTFEVVLYDSDDYGTVKTFVNAPIGIPIIHESTFDDRTMWSPRGKTPFFLLIFPNLITIGMWGFIAYFILNLFKIAKS
jgi:hypothetical protein